MARRNDPPEMKPVNGLGCPVRLPLSEPAGQGAPRRETGTPRMAPTSCGGCGRRRVRVWSVQNRFTTLAHPRRLPCHTTLLLRYDDMLYRRCGRSGIKLGHLTRALAEQRDKLAGTRGTCGVPLTWECHGLANSYGPPPGSAERPSPAYQLDHGPIVMS